MEKKIVTLDNLEYFYEKFKDQSDCVKYISQNLTKEQKQYIDDNFPSKEINAYYSSALKTPKRSFNKNSKYLLCTIPEFVLD